MTKQKVIFDTDPGVDDAIALCFAMAHPEIELLGITTTYGNVSANQAAENAAYLVGLANRKIPVFRGATGPLVKKSEGFPIEIHGKDGLGNLASRIQVQSHVESQTSAQFIVDTARQHPHEISLVAVGPFTNIALALQLDPDLPGLLKQVIVMGGTVLEPGNVSPVAEANVWCDPHAADAVFTAGFNLSMVGLDVTHRVVAGIPLFQKIAQHHRHPLTDTLLHAVKFYASFYTNRHAHLQSNPGCFMHDLLAFIYLLQPEFFEAQRGPVRVVTEGIAQGQTIQKRLAYMNYPQPGWEAPLSDSTVCMQVDPASCLKLLEDTLISAWLSD